MAGADMVLQLLNLVVKALKWGGGLYAAFGLIQLIQGLKNQNSGDTNSGIWTLVGGAVICAVGMMLPSMIG